MDNITETRGTTAECKNLKLFLSLFQLIFSNFLFLVKFHMQA